MEKQEQEILVQAESLFLRFGVKSVTMDDLAREMGISKKTLYQFVENKADLINKVIRKHVEDEAACVRQLSTKAHNAIEEMLEVGKFAIQQLRRTSPTVVYDLKKYYRKSWELLESFHGKHVYETIRRNIQKGMEEGLYRPDLDPDIIARLYVGKTHLLVDETIFPLREYSREVLFNEFISYHLRGIVSESGARLLRQLFNRDEK